MCYVCFFVFFFKQKTAYEMRISDWSSDVCSSDLSLVSLSGWRLASLPPLSVVLRLFKPARSTHSSSVPAGHHLRIFLAPSGRFCTRLWASRRGFLACWRVSRSTRRTHPVLGTTCGKRFVELAFLWLAPWRPGVRRHCFIVGTDCCNAYCVLAHPANSRRATHSVPPMGQFRLSAQDRKSVVEGKSVSVRVEPGGRR